MDASPTERDYLDGATGPRRVVLVEDEDSFPPVARYKMITEDGRLLDCLNDWGFTEE